MRTTLVSFLFCAALCGWTAVCAAETPGGFDFEQKFFVEFGPEVKDHCLLRDDGVGGHVYHLFYLRGNPAVNIGHATSSDLIHWQLEAPVLSVEPNTWDDLALWAPHIIKDNSGNYLMYYTGVNVVGSQQTGIAFSADLYTWEKIPDPVYHPDPAWAEWSPNVWSHGRDPFVFEENGTKYLLNTAKTLGNQGAISLASSIGGFDWQDLGPLYVHNNWHVLESTQLLHHNGKYHLFFTEEELGGSSHMISDSLLSGWDVNSIHFVDFGHAPEVNEFDPGDFVFSRHAVHNYDDGSLQFVIRFDSLLWAGPFPFVMKPWPLAADWTLVSGNAFLDQPTFLNNPAERGETVDVGFEGICWLSSYESYQGPLGNGSPGSTVGDGATGLIRSKTFTLSRNSMNLLVGGGDYPGECYVALKEATSGNVLFTETGKNTDEMDRRYWDIRPYKGWDVYIEICDNSTAVFGHISCDDIVESSIIVGEREATGSGRDKRRPFNQIERAVPGGTVLRQNSPNPFNPTTRISYVLPKSGYVVLDIFDASGKPVRRLRSAMEEVGAQQVTWDGRNDAGAPLPTGIYFYRLNVDGRPAGARKMVLLK